MLTESVISFEGPMRATNASMFRSNITNFSQCCDWKMTDEANPISGPQITPFNSYCELSC